MRLILISLLFLLNTFCVYAQIRVDTLITGEFSVEATRIYKPVIDQPVHISKIDSTQIVFLKGMDLGEMLSRLSFLNIRSNGPGAASVISQRGFGGEQTRVLWEGMPINHQMLGVTDLSLIPANAFSEVEVTSGSGSSLYGSGISGTVYLKNDLNTDQISIGQSVGSTGNYITNGSAGVNIGNLNLSLKGSTQENENDFRYFDQSSGSFEKRERGAYENDHLLGALNYKSKNISAKSSVWWSRADHEITENIFSGLGSATQYDESLRWMNSLNIYTDNFLWKGKIFLGNTTLNYFNPSINTISLSESRELNSEVSATWFSSEDFEVSGLLSGMILDVESNNYAEIESRSLISSGLNASITPLNKVKIYPALRLDHYSDFGTALSPSLGLNVSIIENELAFRGSIARNFRAPTFNDLYWPDGGNDDLKAETGLKAEVGIVHEYKGNISFHQQLNLYSIKLDDGIKWLPAANGRFQALNIQEIKSRGIEWSGKVAAQFGKWNVATHHLVAYTRAFISKRRFTSDKAVGNQLPYVPKIKYSGSLLASISDFSMMFNASFVDERFTTEQGNTVTNAEAYMIFDASLHYSKLLNKTEVAFTAKVNNLFDEQYSIIRFYPMPLRNYLFNITLTQHL